MYLTRKVRQSSALYSRGLGVLLEHLIAWSVYHAWATSCPPYRLKEQLVADGRFITEKDHLFLTEDFLTSSSSCAAALVAGTSHSGPQSWYTTDGKFSLKELEDKAAKQSS